MENETDRATGHMYWRGEKSWQVYSQKTSMERLVGRNRQS